MNTARSSNTSRTKSKIIFLEKGEEIITQNNLSNRRRNLGPRRIRKGRSSLTVSLREDNGGTLDGGMKQALIESSRQYYGRRRMAKKNQHGFFIFIYLDNRQLRKLPNRHTCQHYPPNSRVPLIPKRPPLCNGGETGFIEKISLGKILYVLLVNMGDIFRCRTKISVRANTLAYA